MTPPTRIIETSSNQSTFTNHTEDHTIKLISDDGGEFCLPKPVICQSKVLAAFLDPHLGFAESHRGIIHMKDISGAALKRVVDYLLHRKACEGLADPPLFDVRVEESLELLLIADYLEI